MPIYNYGKKIPESEKKKIEQDLEDLKKVKDSDNLEDRLKTIWNDRSKFYKDSSHYIIKTDKLKPAQVLDEILKILEVPVADH